MPALVWDSGQRHTKRPWFRLWVLALVIVIDVLVIAGAPFILANTDEPIAAWIAFGILTAWTLTLVLEGRLRQSVQLERVTPGPAGIQLAGSRLTIWGTAYRPLDTQVDWAAVESVDVVDAGRENRPCNVVDIKFCTTGPFGTEIRLVYLNRSRAQAFADNALALRSQAAPRRRVVGVRQARR
ncbi:MAG: hypothetical protein ABI434_09840 [Burkholderiaceae bacterium]